ncbi:MAG: phosphoglucosamine mutase [Gemmatimonadota bacterium]|nr:phosphoglucosamine mutase [Gemmatimonadota bacterium]
MVSVSGVRGIVGKDLTPEFVAHQAAAFGALVRDGGGSAVVLARDARTSGPMFTDAARSGLQSVGCTVIDCGCIPTPTAQLAVEHHHAGGGIILTASHNPIEWNALKFVGADGLFLDQATAARLQALAAGTVPRASWDGLGSQRTDTEAVERHLSLLLALPVVDVPAIRARGFRVALDCVRGAGGTAMPQLFERLGCTVTGINLETDGRFPRPPEPIPEHLGPLGELVRASGADVGMAVDPDVDRLALVDETGRAIGEDYTLAFAVEAVLRRQRGPVVVNLSTSLVVDDAAAAHGATVARAPVGEANVARAMRAAGAVVGGEGNGGVMLPALHLGRDAPLAAALVLDLLATDRRPLSERVTARPQYAIVKAKAPRGADLAALYTALESRFADATRDRQDGLRLSWPDRWLHVRPSGTEPIVRLIAEAPTAEAAEGLVAACRATLA